MSDGFLTDPAWLCLDCGRHTGLMDEYYMVADDLWEEHGAGRGMLCVGCLEARAGRRLVPDDFPPLLINHGAFRQSDRLASRIGPRIDVPDPRYA